MNRRTPPAAPRNPLFPPELATLAGRNPPPPLLPLLALGGRGPEPWTARTAIAVAESWSRAGRTVVLADLALEEPRLHELLDLPNGEGLTDVFLFGTSLPHATLDPPGRPFRFVPAGLFAPDPREVVEHPKWDRLVRDMRASRATLLVYLTDRTPGFESLLRHAGQTVVIVGEDAPIAASPVPRGCEVVAVLRRPSTGGDDARRRPRVTASPWMPPAQPGPAAGEEAQQPDQIPPIELSEELLEPAASSAASVTWRPAPAAAPWDERDRLDEPPIIRRRRRRGVPVSAVATVLVLAGAAAAAWLLQPWATRPADAVLPEPVADVPAPPAAVAPEPRDVPLPFSVAVEAHQTLDAARERARVLEIAEPDLQFAVVPTPIEDLVWYRVLAGPAADSAGAEALMRQLYSRGHKTSLDPWAIRRTPWAFSLGDHESRRDAEAHVARLDARDIPAYIVLMPFSEGPPGHRVYAGAFEGLTEADYMRDLLNQAGMRPSLIRRTGQAVE
jgi:hypothetical protein